jgi:hypothetical protein
VAGAGVGTGFFLGAYRILTALAGAGQRAGLVAAIWIVYYLAFSVPVVVAGVATTHFGLRPYRRGLLGGSGRTRRGGRGHLPVPQAARAPRGRPSGTKQGRTASGPQDHDPVARRGTVRMTEATNTTLVLSSRGKTGARVASRLTRLGLSV